MITRPGTIAGCITLAVFAHLTGVDAETAHVRTKPSIANGFAIFEPPFRAHAVANGPAPEFSPGMAVSLDDKRVFLVYDSENRLEAATSEDGAVNRSSREQGAESEPVDIAGIKFHKVRGPLIGGAVLDVGPPGSFDYCWVTCPAVVFDGKQYRMWYSSFYDSKMGRGGIGLATSYDGINWVRANGGKPVLTVGAQGSFDEGQVMGAEVLFEDGMYRMWYTGMSSKWHSSGLGFYRIGLALSPDGVQWSHANNGAPVLDVGPPGAYDEVQAATPSIVMEGGGYRMWYAAWSPETNHTVCVARSRDGVRWERENGGRPVSGLEPSIAYGPAVCRVGEWYIMLYMALQAERSLYAAVSTDGLNWRMLNDGSPVLPLGAPSDFDADLIGHPCLLRVGDRLRAWYTGYRREEGGVRGWKLRIGLAEARLNR